MASTDTTTVKGAIYSTLTKLITTEGNKALTFTGTGLIYYAFPASWSDTNLSSIKDPNNLDATEAFTRTTATVTSTGLTNNYTSVNYVVYYLNTGSTETDGSEYTFNQTIFFLLIFFRRKRIRAMKKSLLTACFMFFAALLFGQGIVINAPLNLKSNNPIDVDMRLASLADTANVDYPEKVIITYVVDVDQHWYYNPTSGTWKQLDPGGGGSSTASETTSTNNFDVIKGTNVQNNLASIDSALVKALGTELFSGGAVTINSGDNTAFDVAATVGQIKTSTGYYNINYAGGSAIAAANIASQSTYVYIDSTGAIGQQTTEPSGKEFREKLFLARLASNGSNFLALEEEKNPSGQYVNLVRDLVEYVPLVKKGLVMGGNANLTFNRSAGSTFELGANFSNDPLDPNNNSLPALDSVTFFLLKQDGIVASGIVDVPVDQYDNGGTLTNITNNNFVIHTVYVFTSGNTTLQYGQAQYSSLDDAQAAINTRSFVLAAANANGTRIGWIIVQEGATDLSNTAQARFVEDIGQSSTSVSVPGALLATNNLSDVDDAAAARANLGGIEAGATADQTAEEMRDSLETLSGVNRLDATYIQKLPGLQTSHYGSLAATIAAVSTTKKTIIVDDAQVMSANLVIPAGVELVFTDAGTIDLDNDTLFVFGSISAPLKQVFDGTGGGTISGEPITRIWYPEWFGATVDSTNFTTLVSTYNDYPAFQYTLNVLQNIGGGVFQMNTGNYHILTPCLVPDNVVVRGSGMGNTHIWSSPTTADLTTYLDPAGGGSRSFFSIFHLGTTYFEDAGENITCEDFSVHLYNTELSNQNLGVGINLLGFDSDGPTDSGHNITIQRIGFYNCLRGVSLGARSQGNIPPDSTVLGYHTNFKILDCFADTCSNKFLEMQEVDGGEIRNNRIYNATSGIQLIHFPKNVIVEGNYVHVGGDADPLYNDRSGILLSNNTTNSIVRGNKIYLADGNNITFTTQSGGINFKFDYSDTYTPSGFLAEHVTDSILIESNYIDVSQASGANAVTYYRYGGSPTLKNIFFKNNTFIGGPVKFGHITGIAISDFHFYGDKIFGELSISGLSGGTAITGEFSFDNCQFGDIGNTTDDFLLRGNNVVYNITNSQIYGDSLVIGSNSSNTSLIRNTSFIGSIVVPDGSYSNTSFKYAVNDFSKATIPSAKSQVGVPGAVANDNANFYVHTPSGNWAKIPLNPVQDSVFLDTLSTVSAWFDAGDINVTPGDFISTWPDKSGNGNNATATSTARPVLRAEKINGQPAVYFDGVNDFFSVPDLDFPDNEIQVFAVMMATDLSTGGGVVGRLTGGTGDEFTLLYTSSGSGNLPKFVISTSQEAAAPTGLTENQWTYLGGYYDGSTISLDVDGVNVDDTAYSGTIDDDNATIYLGRYASGQVLAGYIAEVIILNDTSSTDRAAVYSYIQNKYFSTENTAAVQDNDYGDITVSGGAWSIDDGVVGPSEIASTAVTAGTYNRANITVDADGRLTSAAASTSNIGIGTAATSNLITGAFADASLAREELVSLQMNGLTSKFIIGNATSANGQFIPNFAGFTETAGRSRIGFNAATTSSGDAVGTEPAFQFYGFRTSSTADPLNGTQSNIINQPLFGIRNFSGYHFAVGPTGQTRIGNNVGITTGSYQLHVGGDVNITSGSAYRINGTPLAGSNITYDNTTSGLAATNVKTAIDETVGLIPDNISDLTISADIDASDEKIINLSPGTASTDAATYGQLTGSHALAIAAPSNGDTVTLTNRETFIFMQDIFADPATIYLDGSALSGGAKIYIKYGNFSTGLTIDRDDDNDPGNFVETGSTSGSTSVSFTGIGFSTFIKSGSTWYQMY